MNRRKFFEQSGAAAGATIPSGVIPQANPSASAETLPSPSGKKVRIKLGLCSITYGGIWYEGQALSFEDMLKRAKEFGFEGVELDNKCPMGNPLDLDQRRRDEMKNALSKYGLEIPCVAANNDFSSPIPEHRECRAYRRKSAGALPFRR